MSLLRCALQHGWLAQQGERQGIERDRLTIHADRGSPMKAKATAQLLADLGVTKSHSRPYVSDDNPFSEAQFKTLKYRPDFPESFGSQEDARLFLTTFFNWYNHDHRHSGINMMTPEAVYYGLAEELLELRRAVMHKAFEAHPERFVKGPPKLAAMPEAVWINPPKGQNGDGDDGETTVGGMAESLAQRRGMRDRETPGETEASSAGEQLAKG